MYIGADFLLDRNGSLFLSEVNTGIPAGATEFDLAFRVRNGRPSDVFSRIEAISRDVHGMPFQEHIRSLPWLDDLRLLKIWMDGQGPPPEDPHPALRLEDKWLQFRLLSPEFPMIPSSLWTKKTRESTLRDMLRGRRFVLKRRLTRGGRGLMVLDPSLYRSDLPDPDAGWMVQPFIESRLSGGALSIRAAAFAGRFLCMFASLANRSTSNHGTRFLVAEGEPLGIHPPDFTTRRVVQKSWEADLFYGGDIPDYLYHDVYEEEVAEAELTLSPTLIERIRDIAAEISRLYAGLDFSALHPSWLEENSASFSRL